ncbi:MAG: 2-keto-4-pentenoate hydratase [Halodesulfurarchaeum sp.]
MPIRQSTLSELADQLYEAHESADQIEPLTDRYDLSIQEAYEIQSRLLEHRIEDGGRVVGHKIGLTSEGIQEQFDVDEPDFGRLLDSMFLEDGIVPMGDLIAPRIEPEVGFLLGDDLQPPVTALDALRATEGILPVLEVIDSRIRDWDIEIEDTIADNASSAAFLAGAEITSVSGIDLSLEGVKLLRNGTVVESGVGAAVLGHPARAVSWLANRMDDLGASIEAGDIVISGSVTPAVDIEPGDTVTVEFTSMGTLTARASKPQ